MALLVFENLENDQTISTRGLEDVVVGTGGAVIAQAGFQQHITQIAYLSGVRDGKRVTRAPRRHHGLYCLRGDRFLIKE